MSHQMYNAIVRLVTHFADLGVELFALLGCVRSVDW